MSNSHNFKKKSQNLTTVIFWYDLQEVDREVIDSIRSVQREYIDKRGVEHNFTEVSSTKHLTTHPQVSLRIFPHNLSTRSREKMMRIFKIEN